MPYYGKTRSSKTGRRKAYVSPAVKSYVRRSFPKPELKKILTSADESILDTLSPQCSFNEIAQVAQGPGLFGRNGNSIILKDVDIRGILCNNTAVPGFVRHLVLETSDEVLTSSTLIALFDTQITGVPTDLLTENGLNVIYSPINTVKFKVHWDKVQKIGMNTATGAEGLAEFKMHKTFPRGGIKVRFEGNTFGPGNQDRRLIYLVLWAEGKDDSAGGALELSFQCRVNFTDV